MTGTTCPKCQAGISAGAQVCPECGHNLGRSQKTGTSESARGLMALGAGLMVVGTIVGLYGGTALSGGPKTFSVALGGGMFLIGAITFIVGRLK